MTKALKAFSCIPFLGAVACVFTFPGHAVAIELPAVIADHMVIKRDTRVPLWGRARPGEEVTAEFAGQRKTARADGDGRWMVALDPMAASAEGRKLTIATIDQKPTTIHDVLIGDVWHASGQSNMQMTLEKCRDIDTENLDYPAIRRLRVLHNAATGPLERIAGCLPWTPVSREIMDSTSATAYFFARSLHQKTGVPQGIIEGQRRALVNGEIPNIGMAVTWDTGNPTNYTPRPGTKEGGIMLHCPNKRDVGIRLALWALRDVHGRNDTVVCGPIYRSHEIQRNRVILSFDHIGSGLMVAEKRGFADPVPTPGKTLTNFAIAGEDQQFVWADAEIVGDTVVVSSPGVPEPEAVRFCFNSAPFKTFNLYNKEGLPASPFITDDWVK